MTNVLQLDAAALEHVLEQINGIEYGTVLITLHEGKIVQIDRTERTRFNDQKSLLPPRKPQKA